MGASPERLARLLRVRAIQRDLAAGEAAKAAEQAAASRHLVARIEALSREVSPGVGQQSAFDLAAGAMFRERLARSHADARHRSSTADALLARREAARHDAQRDHRAIEKLAEQARSRAVLAEMRRLSEGPFGSKRGTKIADVDPES